MGDDLLRLPDGRVVQHWDNGIDGPAVVFFHGCPDTRHAAMTGAAAAERLGVRLVAANRPGYGHSTPCASSQASIADDTVAVADLLGIERFAALGMSMGVPFALVCASRHPDRVSSLALVAGPETHRREPGTVAEAIKSFRPDFEEYVTRLNPEDPDDDAVAARLLNDLGPTDAALLRTLRTPSQIAALTREALAVPDGYLRDVALTFRAWEATMEDVDCSVRVWPDRPGAHLSTLLGHWEEILTALQG